MHALIITIITQYGSFRSADSSIIARQLLLLPNQSTRRLAIDFIASLVKQRFDGCLHDRLLSGIHQGTCFGIKCLEGPTNGYRVPQDVDAQVLQQLLVPMATVLLKTWAPKFCNNCWWGTMARNPPMAPGEAPMTRAVLPRNVAYMPLSIISTGTSRVGIHQQW